MDAVSRSTARALALRHRRILAYLVVGVASFTVDVGSLVTLRELVGTAVWVAATSGYWLSVAVNFVLNRALAFRDRLHSVVSVARYAVLLGANWLATLAIISVSEGLGLAYLVGKVSAVVVLMALNYVAYSRWVFAEQSPGAPRD